MVVVDFIAGDKHPAEVVFVTKDGFFIDGTTYKSISSISKEIAEALVVQLPQLGNWVCVVTTGELLEDTCVVFKCEEEYYLLKVCFTLNFNLGGW